MNVNALYGCVTSGNAPVESQAAPSVKDYERLASSLTGCARIVFQRGLAALPKLEAHAQAMTPPHARREPGVSPCCITQSSAS